MKNQHQDQDAYMPPNDPNAERALLGSLLMEPTLLTKVIPQIQAGAFHNPVHTWIYDAMNSLHSAGTAIDFITLQDELERKGILREVGGPAYLTQISMDTPTHINWQYYLNIILDKVRRREMIAAATELAQAAFDEGTDLDAVAENATQKLRKRNGNGKGLRPIKEPLEETIARTAFLTENPNAMAGIPTTFNSIDMILGGLKRGDSIILAGRPSMGKSALAINIAMNQAMRYPDMQILFFSLEMSSESQTSRMLANKASIDSAALQHGQLMDDQWSDLMVAANQLASTGIHIDDTPAIGPADIRAKCKAHQEEHGLDFVIIDYLGLMSYAPGTSKNANDQEATSAISRELKALARELNVPVMTLSQLSRKVEDRADKRPMMSDLRSSGSIEQDADVVMFVYRDDYYNKDSTTPGVTEVIIDKQRNGAIGTANLFFVKHLQRFTDLVTIRQELTY